MGRGGPARGVLPPSGLPAGDLGRKGPPGPGKGGRAAGSDEGAVLAPPGGAEVPPSLGL